MDFTSVLKEIKPTQKEERELSSLVKQVTKNIVVKDAIPILGGSGAKGTWLRNTHDIDIYVKFKYASYKDKSDQLADILHQALKKKFSRIVRLHGSRDYFQIKHHHRMLEIVPILDIKTPQQAQNTTDFSHLHVHYVLQHIKKRRKLADEIRLTKQFAKANHVYGAESYIKGFSGYVLELLTIHYGSFMEFMKAAARWKPHTIIGSSKAAKKLNPSKCSLLIVIDPVQPDRNAAAALSEEKFYDFIMAARAFLKHLSLSFFKEKHINPEQLHRLGTLIQLDVAPLPGNRDIAGAKLLKAFTFIREQIKHYGFTLIAAKWSFNPAKKTAVWYYVLDKHELPPMKKIAGPPSNNTKAVNAFKKEHGTIQTKGNRVYAIVPREFKDCTRLIKYLMIKPEVTERAKAVSLATQK